MGIKDPVGSRARIVAAAARVAQSGRQAFTLEAIAAAAQVSKGGLLHHFASKEALARAVVEDALDQFEAAVNAAAEQITSDSRWLRAFLRVSTASHGEPSDAAVGLSFLSAAAVEPSLMEPVRARYALWTKRFEEEAGDPVVKDILRFAADGVWWADVFGLAPLARDRRQALIARLEELIGESGWA